MTMSNLLCVNMLTLLAISLACDAEDAPRSHTDALLHYTANFSGIEDQDISNIAEIMYIEYDVTGDGSSDILVSCERCRPAHELENQWWCYISNDAAFNLARYGPSFDPAMSFVYSENQSHSLATVYRNGPLGGHKIVNAVTLINLDEKGFPEFEVIRELDYGNEEDVRWLEEQLAASEGLVQRITPEEIAAMHDEADEDDHEAAEESAEDAPAEVEAAPEKSDTTALPQPATDVAEQAGATPDALPAEVSRTPAGTAPPAVAATPSSLTLVVMGLIMLAVIFGGVLLYWRRRRQG